MSQQSTNAAAASAATSSTPHKNPPARHSKRLAANIPTGAKKPNDAGRRRVQHHGMRNVHHASLLERVIEPLSFLAPLLPQSDKTQREQVRKLQRDLGVLGASDDDDNTSEDDVAVTAAPKQTCTASTTTEHKKSSSSSVPPSKAL